MKVWGKTREEADGESRKIGTKGLKRKTVLFLTDEQRRYLEVLDTTNHDELADWCSGKNA